MNLTKNEIEVMDVFWEADKPLSRGDLLKLSVEKSWKSNSVHILLNSLLKKGTLREAGFVRSGKTYGRTFAAAVTCEEYYASVIGTATKTRPSAPALFAAMLNQMELSEDDLDGVEEVLRLKRAAMSEAKK